MRVAFVRHIGPYMEAGPVFERFIGWAVQQGLFGPNTKVIGMGHDNPQVVPADQLRFDCCVTVGDDFKPEGEVGVQTIGGGECAVLTHRGPYERLAESYGFLFGFWLPASGRKARQAPPFEVYLNSPNDTAPENLMTDIHVLLEPR
jgi:AraC family transcriptional regulator